MTKSSFFVFLIVLLGVILLNTACEHIPFMSKEEAAMESGASRHSFDDILVPAGLEVDEKASFIFETGDFKAGTLVLSGYIEVNSLKEYFTQSMPQDGWRLKSIFRFPKAVLLFEKERKVCIIEIYESKVFTTVEIWVAPSV